MGSGLIIRENGGQYTHAAVWVGWAFADMGDSERAARVFHVLNPIRQSQEAAVVQRYCVEPYVVAADVGGVAPYVGRGGWTWYTGSAAWLWRLGVERILGIQPVSGAVRIALCLPGNWRRATIALRRPNGTLAITLDNPDGVSTDVVECVVDGVAQEQAIVEFPNDGSERHVLVRVGCKPPLQALTTESLPQLPQIT